VWGGGGGVASGPFWHTSAQTKGVIGKRKKKQKQSSWGGGGGGGFLLLGLM